MSPEEGHLYIGTDQVELFEPATGGGSSMPMYPLMGGLAELELTGITRFNNDFLAVADDGLTVRKLTTGAGLEPNIEPHLKPERQARVNRTPVKEVV